MLMVPKAVTNCMVEVTVPERDFRCAFTLTCEWKKKRTSLGTVELRYYSSKVGGQQQRFFFTVVKVS